MDTTLLNQLIQQILIFLGTIVASSGVWVIILKRMESKDLSKKLLIGLARDRVVYLSTKYIERGWITQDEYENLCSYLFEPYKNIGGNGLVKRLMDEVNKLPITKDPIILSVSKIKGEKDETRVNQQVLQCS